MAKLKAIKRFLAGSEEVILRYPQLSDAHDLLKNINSLVEERAFIALEKKQTNATANAGSGKQIQ